MMQIISSPCGGKLCDGAVCANCVMQRSVLAISKTVSSAVLSLVPHRLEGAANRMQQSVPEMR